MHKNQLKVLFNDDESEEETVSFKTHNEYAKRYDAWRQKEELHKLEQKYGENPLNSDGSVESDSEDEEPTEMTTEQEEQFLKTLALLKTKDPRIYDPNYQFFKEDETILEKVQETVEEKSEPKKQVNSLAAAFADSDDDDDNNGEGIFKVEKMEQPQKKTNNNKETKLKAYLQGASESVGEETERELSALRALWTDPALSHEEKMLRDYILNNNRHTEDDDGELGEGKERLLDDETLEADEQIVEEQGNFERAYNFRFEEPDQEFLKRYPRTVSSARPRDDRRATRRAEVRARKEQEKARRFDEIARLKALKLKEIQSKIQKIKEVTGNDELGFKEEDLDGDWDPDKHDARMQELFDNEYYGHADSHKPAFPEIDEQLEIENWDEYEAQGVEESQPDAEEPHCEDEDFNMDADFDSKKTLLEEIRSTLGKKRRNRKRKSKLAEVLAASSGAPKYAPGDGSYSQHMEEYYKMDCEDIVAGMPTRFKYRQVEPNDFGLSLEEILLADDKELNKWCPLKKAVKYRDMAAERSDVAAYRQRAADVTLKRKLLPSLFVHLPQEPEIVAPVAGTKTKTKSKAKKTKDDEKVDGKAKEGDIVANVDKTVPNALDNREDGEQTGDKPNNKKKQKKKHKNANDKEIELDKSSEEAAPSKDATITNDNTIEGKLNSSTEIKKRRRKRKSSQANVSDSEHLKIQHESDVNVKKNLKRKLDADAIVNNKNQAKKKKKNNKKKVQIGFNKTDTKNKFKGNKKSDKSDNPLSKLSNERLKAYGLNPKKYRSFLKYKKF